MAVKLFCTWLFFGLWTECSWPRYKHLMTFVGPPRETMFQEWKRKHREWKRRYDELQRRDDEEFEARMLKMRR